MSAAKGVEKGPIELSCADLAELLDAVGTTRKSELSAEVAERCLMRVPELRELWERLKWQTPVGVTGFEVLKAVLMMELEVGWEEGEGVMRRLISGIEGGEERLEELERMAEASGGRRSNEGWVEGVLDVHEEVERLLRRRGWEDPREVLDPMGELGVDASRLAKICVARLKDFSGTESEKRRLLWVLERLSENRSKKKRTGEEASE